MKKFLMGTMVLMVFFSLKVSYAAEVWRETFDTYSKDYVCSNTGGGACEHPSQYTYMYGDTSTSDGPDSAITDDAARITGAGRRGFRLWVHPNSSGTCCENKITRLGLGIGYNFYLRWYQRMNYNTQSNYKKIFRIKTTGGSQRIIIDWYKRYEAGNKTALILATAADNFQSVSVNPNYTLEDDYTPNTWVCFEIFVDQTNDRWTLWVNGEQQGSPVRFTASNYYIDGFSIGGNQVGTSGQVHLVDYDDIVVSTTYIGPDGASPSPSPDTVPAPRNLEVISDD